MKDFLKILVASIASGILIVFIVFSISLFISTLKAAEKEANIQNSCEKECLTETTRDSFDWCVEKCQIINF